MSRSSVFKIFENFPKIFRKFLITSIFGVFGVFRKKCFLIIVSKTIFFIRYIFYVCKNVFDSIMENDQTRLFSEELSLVDPHNIKEHTHTHNQRFLKFWKIQV